MTDQEIRIAVAEECGRCPHTEIEKWSIEDGNTDEWGFTCKKCGKDPHGFREKLPDYPNDLNAMHEAEKMLTEKQVPFYLTRLLQVRFSHGADHGMIACMVDKLAFATARQRAEAFLRVRGKWKDQPVTD